jgi:hypothetical protein
VLEDVKKMILNVLVKNQELTEKKRKAFQYIGRDNDKNERNEIKSVDKGNRAVGGSASMQNYHQSAIKKGY